MVNEIVIYAGMVQPSSLLEFGMRQDMILRYPVSLMSGSCCIYIYRPDTN